MYPGPLALAALYGLLTAASFALWPLARAAQIPGAALFRDALMPSRAAPVGVAARLNVVLVAALVARAVVHRRTSRLRASGSAWRRGDPGWCSGSAARVLMRAARARPVPAPAWARLGVANLHRPGTPTPLLLVSLGLGLSTLAAVALIEGNIRRQIAGQASRAPRRPSSSSTSRTSSWASSSALVARSPASATCTRCPACAPASWR